MHVYKNIVLAIIVLCSFWSSIVKGQQYAIETNYQVGWHLAIHPKYPTIKTPSHTAEIALIQHTQGKKIWSILYKKPSVAYMLAYQTLGNREVLGEGIYFVPALDFKVFKVGRFDLLARVGWGLGIVTKPHSSFFNPTNIVMGSPINACATVRALFRYQISKNIHLLAGGGITHYSNGGFTKPNLGINIPFGQVGLQYSFQAKAVQDSLEQKILRQLPSLNQTFRPFVYVGLGLTETQATRGAKYPIYSIGLGVSRMMARISKLSIAVEYLYNTATYAFDRHNGGFTLDHWNYARFSMMATHELLFGHFGFVTSVGAYFNKHRSQGSVILTKVGFNFYLKNYFKRFKHQLWMGCHVRAYAGEAEFVEVVLGYNW